MKKVFRPLPLTEPRCHPMHADFHCKACRRWADHPDQTWSTRTPALSCGGSCDEACACVPDRAFTVADNIAAILADGRIGIARRIADEESVTIAKDGTTAQYYFSDGSAFTFTE
jgi:hypothetical protein